MRSSTLLVAGAALSLAYGLANAAERLPAPQTGWVLAQATEEACPEGADCPPCPEGAECPAPELPVEEQPVEEQPQPEQPVEEEPQPEQPAEEEPLPEQPPEEEPQPEQPVEEQPQPEQPVEEEPQPEQPVEEEPQPEQPAEEEPQPEQPVDEEPQEPETQQEDTAIQQLEAQGDEEEAENVRTLREQLMRELLQAVTPPSQDQGPEPRAEDDRGDVVEERGGSIIIDLGGGNIYVEPDVPDDGGRLLYEAEDVEVQNLPGGGTRTIVYRRNGVLIVTERDRYGDIVRRTRILPDGTEIVLIDNRFDDVEDFDDAPPPVIVDIPPPLVTIPDDDYIVDLSGATQQEIRETLLAPPVQALDRSYTLEEVLRNEQVRAYSPRLDLDTITFDFGSATIGIDQMPTLFALGRVMEDILWQNPNEVYLIEGHTDAVGSDYDNLLLSYRRAVAVAVALSQNFAIPPENLITEGYGEQYLKIPTERPERRNRRATVVRITELLRAQN